jgi:transposase-like protein
MWCPRCDQGNIVKAEIKATCETIFICEECDAVWLGQSNISRTNFIDFSVLMESKKLEPLWSELTLRDRPRGS